MTEPYVTGQTTGAGTAHVDPNDKTNPAAWGASSAPPPMVDPADYSGANFEPWNEADIARAKAAGRLVEVQPAPELTDPQKLNVEYAADSAPRTPAEQAATPLPDEESHMGPLWIGLAVAACIFGWLGGHALGLW